MYPVSTAIVLFCAKSPKSREAGPGLRESKNTPMHKHILYLL
jgi:hypothetical protein